MAKNNKDYMLRFRYEMQGLRHTVNTYSKILFILIAPYISYVTRKFNVFNSQVQAIYYSSQLQECTLLNVRNDKP